MGRFGTGGARHRVVRIAALLLILATPSCGNLARNDQGLLQPQTVAGPCQVKKFYLLSFTSVRTEMTIGNTGDACEITMLDKNLQVTLTNALVTGQPTHGRATAVLLTAGRQAGASYVPQPGYTGPDRFDITLEPNAVGVTVDVMVLATPPR